MPWDGSELWVGRLDEDGSVGIDRPHRGRIDGVDRQPRMGARRQPRVRLGSVGLVEPVSLAARHAGCRGAARRWRRSSRNPSGCSASASSASMDGVGSSPSRARWVATACWSSRRAAILGSSRSTPRTSTAFRSPVTSPWPWRTRPSVRPRSYASTSRVATRRASGRRARSRSTLATCRSRASWSSPPPMAGPPTRSTTRPPTRTSSPPTGSCRHCWSSRMVGRPRTPTRA